MGRGVINIPHADNSGYKFYCLDLAWHWCSAELLAVLVPLSMASFTVYYCNITVALWLSSGQFWIKAAFSV